jgi:flagellar motility protein MotE (MotC chaperone)
MTLVLFNIQHFLLHVLQAFQEEFEQKEKEIASLNEKFKELETLHISCGDTEDTVAVINRKWQDVCGQFQHFQKGSKQKVVPDSKMVCSV